MQRHARSTTEPPLRLGTTSSTLILRIPARPEALSIIRLVLMSCGASAGLSLREIFSCSQDAVDAFVDVLCAEPNATSVVIRANPDMTELDLIPAFEPNSEASA